ncbi:methyltransferase domain-containing protein [Multifurca ochricompacta]|uniref:Methyltransferase domain-containing protein n=1 Tax=Multifurca ochricompacta TaxID=376703 RepID=A0AAD4M3P7_9AGAM|nr:methyltransferase domain-containing protein [Multifurca ochricompacta]
MPPRPTLVAFVALVTVLVIFFLRLIFVTLPGHSSFYRDTFGPGRSLSVWLENEEDRYALAVQDRQELIKKWGPTDVAVEPYPTHGEFYTIWDFFIPAFQCPHRVQRIGTLGDGGKWVCGLDRVAKQDKCVIYSFGINGESSFESTLLKRAPGCEAWGYDYSVNNWGPEINDDPELKKRAHFKPWALGGTDNHNENDNPKYWTLDSLMNLNAHSFIDILKIDIEGGEFDALTSFLRAHENRDFPVGQLQLEIHARDGREHFESFSRWWASLEAAGLRPFWTEPNLVYINLVRGVRPELAEYSFINIRGNHALVNEAFN